MKSNFLAVVLAVCGAVFTVGAQPANAISYSILENSIVDVPTTTLGYQAPDFFSGTINDAVGSLSGQYLSPWASEPDYGTVYQNFHYTSVNANGLAGYNLVGNMLSLFWGSVDAYNTLTFYTGADAAGDFVTVLISDLGPPQSNGHHLVKFLTTETFRSVTFGSEGQAAFEFANLVATPIPPAIPLFLTGLAGLGLLGRRKKRRQGRS